jgi:hypothetical protein
MNLGHLFLATAVVLSLAGEVAADDGHLKLRALRQARKLVRASYSGDVGALRNTTFDGVWGGRYVFSTRGSTCTPRLTSLAFEHVFFTRGSSGYLSTNHDGDFNGRSRDRGRRWEFGKGIYVNGRPAAVAIVYQNLSRNGNSAATGVAISIRGGCMLTYLATAIRVAR